MHSNQPNPDKSYRILKLQSGEEIITKITGRKNKKVYLDKPMIIKSLSQTDMFGRTKEITFLKEWLSYTPATTTKIPETFVIAWHVPTPDLTCLYDMERNMMGMKSQKLRGPPTDNPMNLEGIHKILRDLDKLESKLDDHDKFVYMNMALPPELAREFFEEGLFEMDFFDEDENEEDFLKEINDQLYTGEEKNDPDYGNRWTDWNPNPLDDEYN